MDIILLTPETPGPQELGLLPGLMDCGVARLHARWPKASADTARRWIEALPVDVRRKTVVHQHHELAEEFDLLGCHVKDSQEPSLQLDEPHGALAERFRSRACHHPAQLEQHCGAYDTLLTAPVFEALSKPGHRPMVADWRLGDFHSLRKSKGPRLTRCCALGGVTHDRLEDCAHMGFEEAAVLGAVWLSADPLATLREITSRAEELP